MPQAKLYYKAVPLYSENFLIYFPFKNIIRPLKHTVQVSRVLNKREGEKGEVEGSGTGRQEPCAYIELDKDFIATNCSILEQSLGHSFLVTAGMPGTLNNYICFCRSQLLRRAFFRDCHSLCSCLLSPHLGANTCPWLPSDTDDTENPKQFGYTFLNL